MLTLLLSTFALLASSFRSIFKLSIVELSRQIIFDFESVSLAKINVFWLKLYGSYLRKLYGAVFVL